MFVISLGFPAGQAVAASVQTQRITPVLKLDEHYDKLPVIDSVAPVAASMAAPASALNSVQQLSGSVTAGLAAVWLDVPSAQYGKFTGLTDDTVYVIGAADLHARNGRRYWDFKAEEIGLDDQRYNFIGGAWGKYKLYLGYTELANLLSSNSRTPFNGSGSATLTLPAGYTKSSTTTGMADLAASLKSVDIGTKRKEGDAAFSLQLDQNFGLSFSFRRMLKNGTKSLGTVVLPDAYSPQGLVLPEPVNYHTDELRTGMDWHGERGVASLEYFYSQFSNNDAALIWENPFSRPLAGYPATGRNSLPPDNQHQRISLSGSFRLASTTRLSALYERGRMTQNEIFLPYTINPASTITVPLPRNSPDAHTDTQLFKLDLATQPWSAWSVHAGYRRYNLTNKTPRDLYQMVINDSLDQVTRDSFWAQYNRPAGYNQKQLTLDAAYHFSSSTTLKLGFDHDYKDYQYRAVNATTENIYSARLNKRWGASATAYMDWAQSHKRADGYDAQRIFESVHTAEYLATVAPGAYFDSLPAMRQFDIADRDRNRRGLGVTLLPRPDLTVGFNTKHNQDKYNASQFGLQQRKTDSYTLDTTITPDEFSSWSLYYTRQNIASQQAGRAYLWSAKDTGAVDPVNDWTAQHQDKIDSVGVNVTWVVLDDKLSLRLGYDYAASKTDINFSANPASTVNTPPTDMPTLRGKRHTLELSGTYTVRDNLTARAGATLESYRVNDWATDGFAPGSSSVPDVLLLSGSTGSYRAVILHTTLTCRF